MALSGLAHAITVIKHLPLGERDGLDEFTHVFNKLNVISERDGCGECLDEWNDALLRVATLMGKSQDELIEREYRVARAGAIAAKYRNMKD